jgi:hypothetical protein
MIKIFRRTVLILLAGCFLTSVQAQTDHPDLQRELNLEKEYKPSLRDALKINQLPEIKAPEAPEIKVTFSNYTLDYDIPPGYQPLRAKTYLSDFATGTKRGYLNGGVSSLLDVEGDVGYQLLNTVEDRLSIFGSHRSTNCHVTYLQTNEKQRMKLNDNVAGVDYRHHFGKAKLQADAQYTYATFNYYGFPIPDALVKTADNQKNNLFRTHLGIESVNNEDLTYKANLTYTLFDQKFGEIEGTAGRTENRIRADVDLFAKFIGVAGSIKNYSYRVPAYWKMNFWDDAKYAGNYNYTTFSFNPYLTFEGNDWNTRLGIKADLQTGGIKKFGIAPDIRFHWRPVQETLLYLSIEGGIKDNSSYDTYYENRYINPRYRIYDSKSPFDGTVGIRFSPRPNLGIGMFTGYKWTTDEHFYTSEIHTLEAEYYTYSATQRFGIQYAHAQTFKWGGTLQYTYQDVFDLGLKLLYQKWNVTKLSDLISDEKERTYKLEAWNKPAFTADLNIGVKVLSDIPFRLDLTYHLSAGRKALLPTDEVIRMKNIHDANLKGEYTLHETIAVFVKLNNLLFQKYDLWYGYPAQNFNIMAGISVKF